MSSDDLAPRDHTPSVGPPDASGPTDGARTVSWHGPRPQRERFGDYELLERLARGGMGVVYRARHTRLNRVVALKMLLSGDQAAEAELARFRTEAEAIARLQHPHIVQVFEIGEHDGKAFLALEFCAGGSLRDALAATPLPPRQAAAVVETLSQAMQAAHQAGVIHRDLKLSNILLAGDVPDADDPSLGPGELRERRLRLTPKVADFGLAKKLDEKGQTVTGEVLGTPGYMAPEQAAGKVRRPGPAVDVYALGAILYELLTGRPPFRAATTMDTLQQVLKDEPVPPSRLQPGVPRDLETICLKCLHKAPDKRYASAAQLAADLRRFQAGEPIEARPAGWVERGWKWAKRRPTAAALTLVSVLALLVVLVGGLWFNAQLKDQRNQALGQKELAEKEAAKAKAVRDFLVSIFQHADPNSKRGTINARDILDEADKRIRREFAEQPELQQELLAAIEEVYSKIGLVAPAAMILEVRGSVQLHAVRGLNQPAVAQLLLFPGDRLQLGADAHVQLLLLSDLHKERLNPAGEVTVRRKGCEPPDAIRERTEDIPTTFVRLPKGTFYMGWDGQKKGTKTEIKEDFEIAVHDVTQGQWQAVMGNNPSWFSRKGNGRNSVLDISDEELKLFPVEHVSWDDVQEFIKKLNEKERGRGFLYRLPTEVEWEYACRGGATSEEECSYHFYFDKPTNDLSSEQANFIGNVPFGKAPKGKFLGRPTRVGAYPPNKLGLCDMHGNVIQWCQDVLQGSQRVIRGGSWYYHAEYCQASYRRGYEPANRNYHLGLRLARVSRPVPGQ